MIRKNRGSTILVTPIIWVITIFIFVFFIVFMVRALEPFTIYQKISETTLKYIFVMEEFGCLNKKEKENLMEELTQKGLDVNNINIYATEATREYGEIVELSIEYKYPFKKTIFNNTLTPQHEANSINICVSKKGVSKR